VLFDNAAPVSNGSSARRIRRVFDPDR
jgi:hypothetical protein